MVNSKRVRLLKEGDNRKGIVAYWMSRDQRIYDNWALLFSQQIASERDEGVVVVFTLQKNFLQATARQYLFMLKGLKQLELELTKFNIPFYLLTGLPDETLPMFIDKNQVSILISDFDPLKIKRRWKRDVAKQIGIPFYEVDAHNIVPCLYVSDKEEYGAYTIRPKINRLLDEFLDDFPLPEINKASLPVVAAHVDWTEIEKSLQIDFSVGEIDWLIPGEAAALEILEDFLDNKLTEYNEKRNDPTLKAQSELSPYIHFGQISAQRIALTIKKHFQQTESSEAFFEELIVRRELADNYCYFNKNYDSFDGFKEWAKNSLILHSKDEREYCYTQEEFEKALTHEPLWNAAQRELTTKGKIQGYMRMYWAKKILEWSKSPQEALDIAIFLNDKYSLDGRDPNGYTGCAWSIGGIHDRAWAERPVFGKIRYMNYNGCKRKFNVDVYINLNKS